MKNVVLCLAMLMAVGMYAQEPNREEVQKDIDEVFVNYEKMRSILKVWKGYYGNLPLDSIQWLRGNYANGLLLKSKQTARYATDKEAVLLQFYYLSTSVDILRLYQKNQYLQEAKAFSENYKELLGYKATIDGQAKANGVLRNLNKEKIEVLQYKYLIQLYNMSNSLKDVPLQKYTSLNIAENPRASLYNQVVATLYLFKVYHLENETNVAFNYGDRFLIKYSDLSFENKKKFESSDAYFRKYFSRDFYITSRAQILLDTKVLNSQIVSKYLEIGKKYSIPGLELHMKGLLVDLKEITSKKEIESLQELARKAAFTNLYKNLEVSLDTLD